MWSFKTAGEGVFWPGVSSPYWKLCESRPVDDVNQSCQCLLKNSRDSSRYMLAVSFKYLKEIFSLQVWLELLKPVAKQIKSTFYSTLAYFLAILTFGQSGL